MVEDPLSEKVLWKEFRPGQTVVVDAQNGEIVFTSRDGVELPELPEVELTGPPAAGAESN